MSKLNICVAIPVKSGNFSEIESVIKKALDTSPDLIELRWDYTDNVNDLTEDFLKNLINLIQPDIPVISTFRDASEGGQVVIDEERRFEILKRLIKAKPQYLDIEMKTDEKILREVIKLAAIDKINLIFSYHDFEKTPSLEDGKKVITDFLKKLTTLSTLKTDKSGTFIYKAIFTANNFEDNFIPIKMCKFFSKQGEDRNIISFCMGDMGIFSRITCVNVGSYLTFGSFEEGTAPGQIYLKSIREIHQLLENI